MNMSNSTGCTELPLIKSNVSVRLLESAIVTGVVTGHGQKDGKPTFDFEYDHRTSEGYIHKVSKWAWPEQVQRNRSNCTDPNEFLLSEYRKYAEHIAEGNPMAFDDWLAGSDLPEIVKARELANVQEGNLTSSREIISKGCSQTVTDAEIEELRAAKVSWYAYCQKRLNANHADALSALMKNKI